MFLTLVLLYFAVTTGYQIGLVVLAATVFLDILTLGTINNVAKMMTGNKNPDQPWEDEE